MKTLAVCFFGGFLLSSVTPSRPAVAADEQRIARALERMAAIMERQDMRGGRGVVCQCR